ncbi:phenylpropionate dioxygenase-like ring-hydroxylating dioxygenase large terminal subunit [Nocardia kruczakiae]|uniref:Phenylpropionate dioxygenase-like ring-hydroxylating dioxygenase large terminal subunit n=1 Tax=Nocardia kruczakiae TaxID=261477 RepID=A0ABU1X7D0_9NOCA|nr:aromatic ring-hydroxylating dioxygenase subunit alpha [Nocardia kruczakiae]MDR7166435.1 phenylpropionate dioxygenase-like ring-hydroxylating dioxygenase large terminal subunit [Nocardia kruczakiae]
MTETADSITETTAAQPLSTPMTIGVDAYISPEYARAEGDKLWAKVWQQVCRVEELARVGDFLTYDILDDSIIVVRTAPDTLRAYHNVCAHRGRRLVDTPPGAHDAHGQRKQFVCGFHGWRYDLEGRNTFVPERGDWTCGLTERNDGLPPVRIDTWGGWVWINLDSGCEPLRDYLEPAASLLDPFHLENMRYRWRRWLTFDCNWKVAFEAFMETYHVPYTHPEFMNFGNFLGWGRAQGRHSNIGYDAPKGMEENQGKLRIGAGPDARISTAQLQNFTWENANTNTTETMVEVANRLADELPADTAPDQVMRYWLDTCRKEDAERGVVWPTVDPDIVAKSGTAWQIFPNFQIGHALNNMLCYRFRPYGYDPDTCIFEAAVFELFPPGAEPETEWIYTPVGDPGWRTVLPQDFDNMAAVQQGMKSRGFAGPKPNPYRERTIVNLHHNLAKYMGTGAPTDLE